MRPVSLVSESANQQDWLATQNMCQMEGCNAPIVLNNSNLNRLCKRHEVEERHKNATARTQLVGLKVPSKPKPFDKKKLYPIKLDEELKTLKRKRPSYGKRSDSDSDQSRISMASSMPSFQTHLGEGLSSSLASVNDEPQRSAQRPISQASLNNLYKRGEDSGWPLPTAINDDVVQSPTEGIRKSTPEHTMHGSTNPQTMDMEDGDCAGSPSDNHFSANSQDPTVIREPNNIRTSAYSSAHEPSSSKWQGGEKLVSDRPGQLREKDTMASPEDVGMPDYSADQPVIQPMDGFGAGSAWSENRAQEVVPNGAREGNVPEKVDYLTGLVSSSTTPGENTIWETSSPEETDHIYDSLEAQRQQIAESYDPSVLDSWLKKQSVPVEDYQPAPQELIETQHWGHVDPQVVWPKKHSEEWLAEKRKEIEARGGRKANFGKLLTAQIIKERREKGWGIHQNKDIVDDEKSEEAAKALQELFGIKDIDDLEPSMSGGQLVMVERAVDEEGNRKKNPAVYIVG